MNVAIARERLDQPQPGANHTEVHPGLSHAHVRFIGIFSPSLSIKVALSRKK